MLEDLLTYEEEALSDRNMVRQKTDKNFCLPDKSLKNRSNNLIVTQKLSKPSTDKNTK